MSEFLVKLVERHIEDDVPVIIEGDFIVPNLVEPILSSKVKALFISEFDSNQIARNFQSREGGELDYYRADISVSYNEWIQKTSDELGIAVLESRPWDNALSRAAEALFPCR